MKLKRTLSFSHVLFYGVGTILGAGIYVLVGKVGATAGMFTPLAFLLAGIVAAFSAFSYAELASRYPHSTGAAGYIHQGIGKSWVSTFFGFGIVLSGIVSASVLTLGFVGYFQVFFPLPNIVVICGLLLFLGLLTLWGIKDSVTVISVITAIEIIGLLIIVWIARGSFSEFPEYITQTLPSFSTLDMSGVLAGMFLAFYAFIGFEDMVNIAEETKDPSNVLPKAIIASLCIAGGLYFLIGVVAVLALPIESLESSKAPLADIFRLYTGKSPVLITIISLFAVVNGIVAQIIMASRILYGMGEKGWIHKSISYLWASRGTPVTATILVVSAIFIFSLAVPIVPLANATSFVTLTLFAVVNYSLIRVKQKTSKQRCVFNVPMWVPVIGLGLNTVILIQKIWQWIV